MIAKPLAQSREEWDRMLSDLLCPWCGGPHSLSCRNHECPKRWFDWGFTVGFHDGANNLERHNWAFYCAAADNGMLPFVNEE